MALNFELVVSDQLFSVVLVAYKWFKIQCHRVASVNVTSEWKKASLGIRGSGKAGKIQAQFMHWVQLMQVNVSENTIPLAYEMSSGRQK